MVNKISIILFTLLQIFNLFGQKYNIDVISLNTDGPAFSVNYYDSGLVFCNNRKDRITRTVLDVHGNEPIDLYYTSLEGGEVKRFDSQLRSDLHDGPISFAKNESYAIVSRNYFINPFSKKAIKYKNLLGLYESRKIDGVWSKLVPFPFNDSTYSCTHPALNEAGNQIIFSSNMPGGQGGFDLWKCNKINGIWSAPENLGEVVNTEMNEVFPSIDGDYLYFSSNRNVYGGLDIYQGNLEDNKYVVEIISQPINSANDDFGLISKDHLESGYLSSNRNGDDQIWKFEYKYPEFENCDTLVVDDFCYTLIEENAHELGGVESLIYRWKINDVFRYGVVIDYCFPEPGDYEITIDIIDTIVDVVYAEQDYFFINVDYEIQPYITSKDTVKVGELLSLSSEKTYLPGVTIDGHYWIVSDGQKFKTKETELVFNQAGIYEVLLGITGVDEYGDSIKDCTTKIIVCTQDEVELVATKEKVTLNELHDNAVVIEQIVSPRNNDSTEVFHDIAVISSREKLDLEDTIFVDFTDIYMITERYDEDKKEYTYHIGQWREITSAYPVWQELIEDKYPEAKIFSYEEIPKGEIFVIENLLFATNKWDLSDKAKNSLNDLIVSLQKNLQFNLLIYAHTDDVGEANANMILSENRAKSVLDYLQSKGIHNSRMTSEGLGESKPVTDNKTAVGRGINRRVEFKLVSQ